MWRVRVLRSAEVGEPVTYPLAPDGIWWTIQGEGHLAGQAMAFLRLAGCSIGCPACDTDYRVAERATLFEIVNRVGEVTPPNARDRWVWITGGEPSDHDIRPLCLALKREGHLVAVATAGERPLTDPVDWLSVSPHRAGRLRQQFGHEIKIVRGLHPDGTFEQLVAEAEAGDYWFRYLQPLAGPASFDCVAWVLAHPGWGLSEQRHKAWGLR